MDRNINTGGAAAPSRDAQPQQAAGNAAHQQLLRRAHSDIPMAAGLAADEGDDASECSETSSEASVPSDQQTDDSDAALPDDSSSGSDDEQPADGTAPAPAGGGGAGGNAGAAAAGADAAAGSEDDWELAAVGDPLAALLAEGRQPNTEDLQGPHLQDALNDNVVSSFCVPGWRTVETLM